jgi:hypothetical protein
MNAISTPDAFSCLRKAKCINQSDIISAEDGFFLVNKSLSDILAEKNIFDFPDSAGQILPCDRFFDDWFVYAVPNISEYSYGLLKLREQEYDTKDGSPADGDTPGVTISFIAFHFDILLKCLSEPTAQNRQALNAEINRVVARKGQKHHKTLKHYFVNPESRGAYLVASVYTRRIASFAENGSLDVPEYYKNLVQKSLSYKCNTKFARLPRFIEFLNQQAGYAVCDNTKIYIKDRENPDIYESAAILATHTGNTSLFSFAAEVEYHARFLMPLAKIKIPFFGRSVYDSAIRADMTVGDTEFEGPAPFYNPDSRIVKRQYQHHKTICFNYNKP